VDFLSWALGVGTSAAITIAAHYMARLHRSYYIFKPLTTVLILALALFAAPGTGSFHAWAIRAGLIFSLVGDVLLMLPGEHFVQGLGAFLLAHLCYIFAFAPGIGAQAFAASLLPMLATGLLGVTYLWGSVPRKLRIPVAAYAAVISLMAACAIGQRLTTPSASSTAAAAGALVFVMSDALLAVNRFRHPFRAAQGLLLTCYFAGQFLIAWSIRSSF